MKLLHFTGLGGDDLVVAFAHVVMLRRTGNGLRSSLLLSTGSLIELRNKYVEALDIWQRGGWDEPEAVSPKRRAG